MKATFEEIYKPERTRLVEGQRGRQQLLPPTTAMHETTCPHQPTFTQTEMRTGPTTTTPNLLQPNQHQAMTPPWVISSNTHMTNHILQQQNTPTRDQPTSQLSRHSTPIQQKNTNTGVLRYRSKYITLIGQRCQDDIYFKIELIYAIVLSSRVTN